MAANAPWTSPGRAQYIGRPIVTKAISAQNTFSTGSYFAARDEMRGGGGSINLSVSGTFTATVTLQVSYDDGATWNDVETYTAPVEKVIEHPNSAAKWRIGVKTGEYGSGTVNARLSQA